MSDFRFVVKGLTVFDASTPSTIGFKVPPSKGDKIERRVAGGSGSGLELGFRCEGGSSATGLQS